MQENMNRHDLGVILEPSEEGFDSGSATFGCAFVDEDDPTVTYLYYSGARDVHWSHSSIGVAVSNDRIHFKKLSGINPIIDGEDRQFNSMQSATPSVVRVRSKYYMFFAGRNSRLPFRNRRIGIAYADDPKGPWQVIGVVAKPEAGWEGWGIDLGPNVAKLSEHELLVYYSNVTNRNPMSITFGRRSLRRRIGILKVRIDSPKSIKVLRYSLNPLKHLNGPKGSPSESMFSPGYFFLDNRHFLLPTSSTYSVGFPYRQHIGVVCASDPFFTKPSNASLLIDGHKDRVINAKSEIALDTPSPILSGRRVYVYYAVMDRSDNVWKIALSTVDKQFYLNAANWKQPL